ncbi:MAG: glycosyltransferase family A protein [bacterium]
MIEKKCIDVMYLACNRLEFTQETFTTLVATTDWQYVHELFVYDDGSRDGTCEWLEENIEKAPVPGRFVKDNFGSPIAAMVHFINAANKSILAKVDNDTMLPPAWLRLSLDVFDRHPKLSLLGIEAMCPHHYDVQLARSYIPARFIGGLGLFRRCIFTNSQPKPYRKWFGFQEWQTAQGNHIKSGWITPAIPTFLLDRVPFKPWTTYTQMYIRRGWQRSWPKYNSSLPLWDWRWPSQSVINANSDMIHSIEETAKVF